MVASGVRLAELSWTEVDRRLESGTDTVILPVGATEQHGPHLPLGTDTYVGRKLAERTARRLSDALVAPAIQVGCSPEHLAFPGTMSVRPSTLTVLLEDYLTSLENHGFAYLVLLPTHGGNYAPVDSAAAELVSELDDSALIQLTDSAEYSRLMNAGLQEAGIDYEQKVLHAGAVETSLMRSIDDQLVHAEKATRGPDEGFTLGQVRNQGFDEITPSGVLGDPTQSSERAGDVILEKLAGHLAELIENEIDSLER